MAANAASAIRRAKPLRFSAMSHLDFSIPATWVAWSYLPLAILLAFLLIKLGSQYSLIKAHERLVQAMRESLDKHQSEQKDLREKIGRRIAEVAQLTIRAQRQMESDQAELAKCIAASKRKDHEIEELNGRVNSLLGNSGEIPCLSAPRHPGLNS